MAIIAPDIGIDLGTSNTLVYVKHKGVVLNEPTLMVVTGGQKKSVKAFGEDARLMLGRTTGEYQSVRPLEDGVIKDYDMTEYMLEFFIRKAIGMSRLVRPRGLITIPSRVTAIERRAVRAVAFTCQHIDRLCQQRFANIVQYHSGACHGEAFRIGKPQTARRTGDQSRFSR